MNSQPWVEKYRPKNLENVVLETNNKIIFDNCINKKYIPNMLFYGPPGTGKTTTVVNIISKFHLKYYGKFQKELIIHLNASDERGIDMVRNQLNTFVKTKPFFLNETKVIILDEVDYMTKNAQRALSNLIQNNTTNNTAFCLICNYISRIEKCLKNELILFKFSSLPKEEVFNFLKMIIKLEKINKKIIDLDYIYENFKSDMRSMINYLQSQHQSKQFYKINRINLQKVIDFIKKEKSVIIIKKKIINECIKANVSIEYYIQKFIIYILKYDIFYSKESISLFKFIIQTNKKNHFLLLFFLSELQLLFNKFL